MSQPVKVGVIGCGVIGSRHIADSLASNRTELVAVADLLESYRDRVVERFQPPKVYETGADLIADAEIEVVVLVIQVKCRFTRMNHAPSAS